MEKCLVTKLNGSSDNSELLKVGEMRMKISKVENPTISTQGFNVGISEPVTLEIIGEGYFTNENLTENKGKTLTLNTGNTSIFVSNNDVEIAISDKYNLKEVGTYSTSTVSRYGANKLLNIADLKYSSALTSLSLASTSVSGDIADLRNLTALITINLNFTKVSGDIADLKNLTALKYLNLASTAVSGDIANLKNLTALITINLNSTEVSGDIADLKNLTASEYIDLNFTKVSGDIADLRNLTALTSLNLTNTSVSGNVEVFSGMKNINSINLSNGTFTGDLSKISDNCKFISFYNSINTVLSWTNRPSTANILAIAGNVKITDVDKMLQDQAQCKVGYNSSSSISEKTISCVGTRTSASDAAVATLQSKGYTVSITPA